MAVSLRYQELPLSATQLRRMAQRPTLHALLALPPRDIIKQLRERWRGLPEPLAKLASVLLRATPTSVAWLGDKPWLLLERMRPVKVAPGSGLSTKDFEPDRHTVWLSEPIPNERAKESLRSIGHKPSSELVDFFAAFGELRDIRPPVVGNFQLPSLASIFPSSNQAVVDGWRTATKWQGATVLYHAPNGDVLLLHRSGRTAWAQLETGRVLPFAPSFLETVAHFRRRLEQFQVFDSWGR